jgi:lipopolysaccharide/colanic/teichoic acid biosynthesis glycosyltransferase
MGETKSRGRRHDRAKRVVELMIVPPALVALAPVYVVVAVLVRVGLGSPVLYRGQRVGRDDRIFEQLKFRTMIDAVDEHGVPLPDGERITRLGRVLRSLSLDELPQLFNVLRGDMSLVGPRPLPVKYLERYSPAQRRRHEVRPGLTGLAQSEGRNTVPWAHRFALDVTYVEQASFRLDLAIIKRSVQLVLARDGISAEGHATAPEFLGASVSAVDRTEPVAVVAPIEELVAATPVGRVKILETAG